MSSDPFTQTLAARTKSARDMASLSQAELAARLGVSLRTVQSWEAGVTFPQPAHRRRLTALLRLLEEEAAA